MKARLRPAIADWDPPSESLAGDRGVKGRLGLPNQSLDGAADLKPAWVPRMKAWPEPAI